MEILKRKPKIDPPPFAGQSGINPYTGAPLSFFESLVGPGRPIEKPTIADRVDWTRVLLATILSTAAIVAVSVSPAFDWAAVFNTAIICVAIVYLANVARDIAANITEARRGGRDGDGE